MNINYKEPQFELFPANSATLEDINKPKFLLATLTLSTESLVILVILGIMIALFSFSLGVERGKHLAAQSLDEKVAAAWNVGGRRLAATPVVTAPVTTSTQSVPAGKISSNKSIVHPNVNSHVAVAPVSRGGVTKSLPETSKVATSSVGRWVVQLGTYRNENYAKQDALGLKAKGYPVYIVKFKDYYLVSIGPLASQEQADAFLKKVQNKFQGSQVRRI